MRPTLVTLLSFCALASCMLGERLGVLRPLAFRRVGRGRFEAACKPLRTTLAPFASALAAWPFRRALAAVSHPRDHARGMLRALPGPQRRPQRRAHSVTSAPAGEVHTIPFNNQGCRPQAAPV